VTLLFLCNHLLPKRVLLRCSADRRAHRHTDRQAIELSWTAAHQLTPSRVVAGRHPSHTRPRAHKRHERGAETVPSAWPHAPSVNTCCTVYDRSGTAANRLRTAAKPSTDTTATMIIFLLSGSRIHRRSTPLFGVRLVIPLPNRPRTDSQRRSGTI
jgi:hypothetical protein